ncbi:MAG TPA: aconitase family protein, partial [Longimicrobiales bacterium]|nr:aconitase family protein [Longimicrobiales bacterium]
HAGRDVAAGDMVDIEIDARIARDFGGANVVKNLLDNGLGVADPARTFFTFDCNPGGSDQSYASNQQRCRVFARQHGIRVYDIDAGIGTHVAIDEGLVGPGGTLVSTDSHANILGAIGAFGQGMGDQDIAHAFAHGTTWFVVPQTVKVTLTGRPSPHATPKDVTLALTRHFGANGLLGYAAEVYGDYIDHLNLAGRVTLASMCTEMGGITMLFPPNAAVLQHCERARERFISATGRAAPPVTPVYADSDAAYAEHVVVDIEGLEPMLSRPGHPEDVVPVSSLGGRRVDSVFIGSCTNGRYEDFAAAARVLEGRRVAAGVVLKVVPATDVIWRQLLEDGVVQIFKDAGALFSNAGCAGCAAGQIGQNGPGEVTVSTGNRNFPGKQGKGEVFLASPETAAACAVAGVITAEHELDSAIARSAVANAEMGFASQAGVAGTDWRGPEPVPLVPGSGVDRPTRVTGRVWVIPVDNIDTDMIFHNRYLTITDMEKMGQYAFDNLAGREDFAGRARPGDIVIAGKNFGCGSSRQQAVDCFLSLDVAAVVAESFGAIYERNAINAGLAILAAPAVGTGLRDGDVVTIDFRTGEITPEQGAVVQGRPFSDAQLRIYQRGGLLAKA